MASDPIASSLEPEGLVAQACDPGRSPEDHHTALAALAPFVEAVAVQCARQLIADEQVRQDLIDQAFAWTGQRLQQYDPAQGPFRPWLSAVLTHLGQDLRRRWQRHARRHRPLPDQALASPSLQAPALEEREVALTEAFGPMRADLDRINWPASQAVDYYAALLVFLRVETVACCRRARLAEAPGEAVARAASWLPWRAEEEPRRFRAGLPSLAELWLRLAAPLEHDAGLQVVLDALNDPPPEQGPVSYSALAQWIYRARKMALDRLGPVAWHGHGFARLLCPSTGEAP